MIWLSLAAVILLSAVAIVSIWKCVCRPTPLRLLAVLVCVPIVVYMFTPSISCPLPPNYARNRCMSHLHQIGVALYLEANEGAGADYAQLVNRLEEYVGGLGAFVCPVSGDTVGDISEVQRWTSYTFVIDQIQPVVPGAVTAFCAPHNHDNKGGNILFRDGQVEWYEPEEFVKVVHSSRSQR